MRIAAVTGLAMLCGMIGLSMRPASVSAETSERYSAPMCGAATGGAKPADPPVADMYGVSELVPDGALIRPGLPMSWALHPRLALGNNPPPGWTSMVPWGQVFISVRGSDSRNTRVEVRNLRLFVRPRTTGAWCLLQATETPSGAYYHTNFAGDVHQPGDQRVEPDGGRSFLPTAGSAIHFYSRRIGIPTGGVSGVYAEFEARTILADADGPDDRDRASLVASAGTDYWISDTAPSGYNMTLNEDAGIGRFRRVTTRWQTYSMNTAAPGAIQRPM